MKPTEQWFPDKLMFISDSSSNTEPMHCIQISNAGLIDPSLSTIKAFCNLMRKATKSHEGIQIAALSESSCPNYAFHSRLLWGAYLILYQNLPLTSILSKLLDCEETKLPNNRTLANHLTQCLRALDHAKSIRWLGHDEAEDPILDLDVATHYAQPANGNLRVLIPGQLLLMPAPRRDLPPGHDWIDEHPPGRPAARHFSADFLADLLADLGVPAVAYLGRATDAEAAAFEARGLDVHDLGPERGRPALLGALDRLLAVSRAVGGPVAVYDGDELIFRMLFWENHDFSTTKL